MVRASSRALFPEHNSGSQCADTSQQRGNCKYLAENVLQNPVIEQLVRAIRQSGCYFNFGRNVAYEKCAKNVCGGFDWKNHQVILCANENQTEKKVLKALAHELVHMFDSCRAGFNLESIEDLACSEIRAANLIHCQPVHWSLADPVTTKRKNRDTAECIKRIATHSVRLITGVDDVLAKEAVEKAYVRCYADFEPFCKHLFDRYSFNA
ncbi:mitochondrial inner membrane protease ATP23 [Trichuris trichiura]|uniref:Mitochondrial inner membrane protease ATP23 n=1 Tax=Trichuris trichiura TaxID=36087 RepID=A0A077Z8P8_TRITR|nr:mitochondrial inner membrane protease ATP23 [Trichuris trichiura]